MKTHREFPGLLFAALMLTASASATTYPFTVSINASNPGPAIPADFVGAAISNNNIAPTGSEQQLFLATNTHLVNLFKQIGIAHLRTIRGKADPSKDANGNWIYPDATNAQIDAFFDFAHAIGITGKEVIWSLHLMNADTDGSPDVDRATAWSNNTAVATHIWNATSPGGVVEQNLLQSFAFDNEPDWLGYINGADPVITGYSTPTGDGYIDEWREWKGRINTTGVAPGCKFSGPDTGSKYPEPFNSSQNQKPESDTEINSVPFTLQFARDEDGTIQVATQHWYNQHSADSSGNFLTTAELATDCLDPQWTTTAYQDFYTQALNGSSNWPNNAQGVSMPYRFTECSPFTNDGGNPGQHCVATALWGLDFCHWWARHGCSGIDPFTRPKQYNSPIFATDSTGTNFTTAAYGYGLKAFKMGSDGNVIYTNKFTISNPNGMNVTAYGVVNATTGHLYVTIINKGSTGDGAAGITISTLVSGSTTFTIKHAYSIVLCGGATAGAWGDPTVLDANIGGQQMSQTQSSFTENWTQLPAADIPNSYTLQNVSVQPTNAMIIDLRNY